MRKPALDGSLLSDTAGKGAWHSELITAFYAQSAAGAKKAKKEEKLNKRQQRSEESPAAESLEQPDEATRADE